MKITLVSLTHDAQWMDPSGDLHRILDELLVNSKIDVIAEEAVGLPTTVAQRLAHRFDKPWIEIDMSIADRKLAGIHDAIERRPRSQIDPIEDVGSCEFYLPEEDGVREREWLRRTLTLQVDEVLCLCGLLHKDPFATKLRTAGCDVEHLDLTQREWFRKRYGTLRILEKNGARYCETRRPR